LTIARYTAAVRDFAQWYQLTYKAPFDVRRMIRRHVRAYKDYMMTQAKDEEGYSPNTINTRLSGLAAFGKWAAAKNLVAGNPSKGVEKLEQQDTAPRWLTPQQTQDLWWAIETDVQATQRRPGYRRQSKLVLARRDAAVAVVMLAAGLRVSEVVKLRVGDVQISERKGSLNVRFGKKDKSRIVPLNTDARSYLSAWMELLPSNAPTAPLFVDTSPEARRRKRSADKGEKTLATQGKPYDPLDTRTIQRIVAHYGKVADIKGLTPHVLRHTCAKSLIDEGISIDRVADTLLRGAQEPGDDPTLHPGQPGRSAGRGGKDRHQVGFAVKWMEENRR
jgi:integrase/recombinase XerD